MTTIERVQAELQGAMKSGDRARLDALRLLYSALQRAEKTDRPASSPIRMRWRCFAGSAQRGRGGRGLRAAGQEERASREEADIPVIDAYLPAAMSEAELEALVDAAIAETGATTVKDMGRVMGLVTQRGEGRADGRTASALVRSRLSA
jgi:uncharacterized protein YqeY